MRVGERIWNVERLYNLREGFTKDDDMLPERFFEEEVNGRVIDKNELVKTRDEYYRMRGWADNGVPTKRTLRWLGIEGL